MPEASPRARLEGFLAKFDPKVAAQARAAIAKVRKRIPAANVLVYDNYNALAVAFGPTERASEVVCSIAVYPRWVSLFLMNGPKLPDPEKRLRGSGTKVRHVVLETAKTLDERAVKSLLAAAIARADPPIPKSGRGATIVKSVSAKQRPRRPGSS